MDPKKDFINEIKKTKEQEEKTMYRVEKFIPSECPKCRHKLDRNGEDWGQVLGDIINGEKVPRKTDGYIIIICVHCKNQTACIPLEAYTLSDPVAALKLLEEGFVNYREVIAVGKVAGQHTVYTEIKNLYVVKIL